MRIAILGSAAMSVPPSHQGGTEWIAYYQAKGLAGLGHKITLVSFKGSLPGDYKLIEIGYTYEAKTSADIDEIESSRALRTEDVRLAETMWKLAELISDYDLILNNMRGEAVFLPLAKFLGKPLVNVMHLPLFPELANIFKIYNTNIITISNNQRKKFPDLNYLSTVYNCVDTEKYVYNPRPKADYLLMMGTIGRHKNQGAAVRIAKKLGMKLILAGKIRDKEYFEELKKDIDGEQIQWFGELDFGKKVALYQNAKAFLFPIVWEEPFGLVMIEAMACGTPVVAFGNGAIPEVIVNGKTGFVIENNSEEEMAEAVRKIDTIKRQDSRNHVMENFTVEKMVKGYEAALAEIIT